MKNKNIISPVGLKGNQINERMKELMGISSINENKSNIVVELTKMGPDGKAYAIIRENHDYYIKSTTKTSGLIAEDFKYIGGLQNKKQEAYPSYAKAIKHLNLRFNSLSEAFNSDEKINTFLDDNLLAESGNGFSGGFANMPKGGGFSGEGNLDGNSSLYEEEETDEDGETINEKSKGLWYNVAKKKKEGRPAAEPGDEEYPDKKQWDKLTKENKEENKEEDYGTHINGKKLEKPDPIVEEEDLDEVHQAVDDMLKESWMEEELHGNQHKIDMNHNGKVDGEDLAMLRNRKGMEEELTGNQDKIDMNHNGEIDAEDFRILRGMDEEEHGQQPMSTGQLMDMIDNMSASDFIQFLKDASGDIKSKVMTMISSGADKTRDYLNQRYPENEGSLYEGKLSINRAIDQMDTLIDGLSDLKKKVKTQI